MRETIEVFVSNLYKNSNGKWSGLISTLEPSPIEGKKLYLYKLTVPKELVAEFAGVVDPEEDQKDNEKEDSDNEKTSSAN